MARIIVFELNGVACTSKIFEYSEDAKTARSKLEQSDDVKIMAEMPYYRNR